MDKGYVYILTNPSFRNDWVKIGKSAREVNVRSKELDNTAVPLPFEVYAWLQTSKYNEVEMLVHKTIDRLTDLRIRQNREFFNVPPEQAYDILKDIATTLDDAVLWCKDDKEENVKNDSQPRKKPRENFRFSLANVPIGAEIVFVPTGIKVKVASDNTIEYENRIKELIYSTYPYDEVDVSREILENYGIDEINDLDRVDLDTVALLPMETFKPQKTLRQRRKKFTARTGNTYNRHFCLCSFILWCQCF